MILFSFSPPTKQNSIIFFEFLFKDKPTGANFEIFATGEPLGDVLLHSQNKNNICIIALLRPRTSNL
jgi:hypothetical protein